MSSITVTATEKDGRLDVTVDREPSATPQEVMGLICHAMIDATATVILADAKMGPALRTVEPEPGQSAEEAAQGLARGMAVSALTSALPQVLARERAA